jgi:hypothetical protein
MAHVVYYNEGSQSIRTAPMRGSRAVVVAAGTYSIKDLRYPESDPAHLLATGSVTIDSVSTTLAAAAGRSTSDPRQLTVASAVGIVSGRRYLLRSGGRDELVQVEGVSGTTVRLRHEVRQPFVSGAHFLGLEVSCEVPAEVAATDTYLGSNHLAVRWDLDDLPPVVEQVFVQRAVVAAVVTRSDVLQVDPKLAAYDGSELSLDQAIMQATNDLRVDLLGAGLDDSTYLTGLMGKQAIAHGAGFHLLRHLSTEAGVRNAEYYRERYSEIRNNLITGAQKAQTAKLNEDGSAKAAPDYHSIFLVQW